MNIKLLLLIIFIPFFAISHEVNIKDKNVEEIVKQRMGNMSKVKAYSSKMYPLTMTGEFDEIKLLNEELLHAAKNFKELFPEGSQSKKASDLIWEDRETFNLYNDNFVKSIEDIAISIEKEDSVSLMENFNIMASNCGTCHKKFRN
ncbi:cytochrome c [Alphaproteobacteria bacterium]|nr:cytochrome c [Alphaproteobacteria bacterium]MDC3269886.1 cytochrome c [Alphaproteobacteria bacterium]